MQNNLSMFALSFIGIPSTPEEDYIGGKTVWRDGKLRTYDWGKCSTIYIAHYDEVNPEYDRETGEATGKMITSTRAVAITVENPITREKLIEQGRKDIYMLNGMQEQLNFTQDILNGYMSDPTSEKIKTYEEVTNWLEWQLDVWEGLTPETAKAKILKKITEYDSSDAVNQFYLGETPMWLDKETRVGLVNSITIEQKTQVARDANIVPMTSLWYGNIKVELPCELALGMLSALELYALQCYNVTANHKSFVESLTSVDDILAYDYKVGYPDKLHFEMSNIKEEQEA